ncbi:MAG: thioredoxin-dependent thiol peroxidase [Anaerolineales bacterium]
MPIPRPGSRAPDFEMLDHEGKPVRLSQFLGKTVVLYFYPKDDTPGCTREACSFRDDTARYRKEGAVILGVSPDPPQSHSRFREKFHLTFPLLADEDHKVSRAYGVWGKKKFIGREYMGLKRTTFIVDPQGKVRRVFEGVRTEGHSQEVLNSLQDKGTEEPPAPRAKSRKSA